MAIQSTRIRPLKDAPERAEGRDVLYWMQSAQRAGFNPALEFAVEEANHRDLPVVVGFGLTDGYPEANARHYAFMLQGLAEVAERLEARGFASAAINGDMPQKARERTIEQLRGGKLDILVATDVAARGLDVERVSHVVNYDMPYDPEAYVHRIGRTGRAGRHGDAILFVTPRETRMLRLIEKVAGAPVEPMALPSPADIADSRRKRLMQTITDTLRGGDLGAYADLVCEYQREHEVATLDIAAALARLVQGETPLQPPVPPRPARREQWSSREDAAGRGDRASPEERSYREDRRPARDRPPREERPPRRHERGAEQGDSAPPARRTGGRTPPGFERFRIEVGRTHRLLPGAVVGAIANEAGLDGRDIGRIDIFDDHSTVELPAGMPKEIFEHLRRVRVAGQALRLSRLEERTTIPRGDGERPPRKKLRHRDRRNKGAPRRRK